VTEVCFVGDADCDLKYELLSRETAREALSTYDLRQPFENTIALSTVSLGAAVSLCNDLNWYVVRFVDDVLVREPSVEDDEWLSRELATAVRDGDLPGPKTGEYLKVYGLASPEPTPEEPNPKGPPSLVEPLYVTRQDGDVPEYDLQDVDETVVVRLTEGEFTV
jgi:hypothetical protein